MAIKVVVLDSRHLPVGVDFPPLRVEKYGWKQHPQLNADDIADSCWRADVVVTLASPVDCAALESMPRIGLLICAGEACSRVDQAAAFARGVELLFFPEADYSSTAGAQDLCDRVSAAIEHYIRTAGNRGLQR